MDLYCLSYLNWLAVQSSATMGGPILFILFQQREKRKETNNGRNGTEGRIGSMGVHVHISLHVCHKTTKRLVFQVVSYLDLFQIWSYPFKMIMICMIFEELLKSYIVGWEIWCFKLQTKVNCWEEYCESMHCWLLSKVWNIIAPNLSIFSTEKIPRVLKHQMVQGGDFIS